MTSHDCAPTRRKHLESSERSVLAGCVALVTGANTGIGRVTAVELARRGAQVFLACRSRARTQPALDEIRAIGAAPAEWLPLELADFDSVRECARTFLARGLPLHFLINNAGLMNAPGETPSGFEPAFGVNHMGHFLLTDLLLERLRESAPARVVTVASRAHMRARGIDWQAVRQPPRSIMGLREYCVSKLANVLFSAELSRRLRGSGVSTYALHPGVIDSDLWRMFPKPLRVLTRFVMVSNAEGAKTTLHCALDAPADETGLYYSDCRPVSPSAAGSDLSLAQELWRRSQAWVG